MYSAAGEGVRVCATASSDEREELTASFVRRRLEAVPNVPAFHEGGAEDWDITVGFSEEDSQVSVAIRGHVRPLPLVGAATVALLPSDDKGAVLEVRVSQRVRPQWLEGGFHEWISQWG